MLAKPVKELDATDLAQGYGAGAFSPKEVVADVLSRIEQHNTAVNAFSFVDTENSQAQAAASEARWLAGDPKSAIDGVPVTIKELLWCKGWNTTMGSKAVNTPEAQDDAPAR